MKVKLTVTVDADLIAKADALATKRGVSLSQLVEDSLRAAIQPKSPSFSERWRGAFHPADRDEHRYQALRDKYLS